MSVGRSPRNFATSSEARSIYKCQSKNLGACPPKKNWGAKNMLNLARFWTPYHFELKYLWNGQRYPKNKIIASVASCVRREKSGELWSIFHSILAANVYSCNQQKLIKTRRRS